MSEKPPPIRAGDSDRVIVGKIAAAMIRRGWRPPPLTNPQAERLLDDLARPRAPNATNELSPRELEVLQVAATGRNARETADTLGVSFETIKKQSSTVRRKLGARNTTHAVAIALRRRVIA